VHRSGGPGGRRSCRAPTRPCETRGRPRREDRDGQNEHQTRVDRFQSEEAPEPWNDDGQRLHEYTERHGAVQDEVDPASARRPSRRIDGDELPHGLVQEQHRARGQRPVADHRKSDEQRDAERTLERAGHEDEPLGRSIEQTAPGRSRQPVHQARGAIESERQRGRAVAEEVDPEELQRGERHEQQPARVVQPGQVGHRGAGHDEGDQRDVGREREADEALDVLVDAAPLLDGSDDGGEVVVEQHEVGHFTRHFAPALAHRDTDVGALERRRVVDPVPGHRDDFPVGLERLDEPQLVFGAHPGEDVRSPDLGAQRLFRQLVELLSGHHLDAAHAGRLGDRPGRRGVVAGDHEHAHSGPLRRA